MSIYSGHAFLVAVVALVALLALVSVDTARQVIVGSLGTLVLVLWVNDLVLSEDWAVLSLRAFVRVVTTPLTHPSWLATGAVRYLLVSSGGAHGLVGATSLGLVSLGTEVAFVTLAEGRIRLCVDTFRADVACSAWLYHLACPAVVCFRAV